MKRTVFKKAKLAAAIALTSSTLAMTGCLVEGDDAESVSNSNTSSAVGNNHQRVTAPKGTVMGVVQDTNGNPIIGATVYIGNSSAVTTDGGTYQFDDIAAVRLQVTGDKNYAGDAVQVVIVPPQGYLGATVTVTPVAVLDAGQDDTNSSVDVDAATASTSTFIDGFSANAGTAVLPALTALVKGFVQVKETGSNELLKGKSIALDMKSVNEVDQQQDQNGVTTSYQTLSYTSVINDDGEFLIENVPADSTLNFVFDDFEITGVDAIEEAPGVDAVVAVAAVSSVVTKDEQLAVNVGTILVNPIESIDEVAPFVVSVENVVALNVSPALLKDDVTNQLVVHFSEGLTEAAVDQIQNAGANSVVIRDVDANAYLNIDNLVVAGNQLTITLAQNLTAGNIIHINLLKSDFMDQAVIQNTLVKSDKVGFDSDLASSNENGYLRLTLKAFSEDDLNAVTPTLTQQTHDNNGINDVELVQLSSNVFNDVADGVEGIQQLNSSDSDDESLIDSAYRLSELASALSATVGGNDINVDTSVARLSFAPTSAAAYQLELFKPNGEQVTAIDLIEESLIGVDTSTLMNDGSFKVDGSGVNVEGLIQNVAPGYEVKITPLDELGYPGTAAIITLADNVPPTTILQDAYGILDLDEGSTDTSSVVSLQYGDGGEQASGSEATIGAPYFNVTPRLLGQVDGTDDGANDDVDDIQTFVRLYEMNTTNTDNEDISGKEPGEHYIDPDSNVYDANAFTSYIASETFSRTVGVAFSEDVALVGAPAFTTSQGVVNALTVPANYVVENDVFLEDDGDKPGANSDPFADLIRFDIQDVYQFALNEGGSVLDFQNAITDTAITPNAGATKAKVVFRDMIPALVTEATYSGEELVVKFDKAVVIDADDGIELDLGGETISLANEDDFLLSADGMTLTVYSDAWGSGAQMNIAAAFNLGQFDQVNPKNDDFDGDTNLTHAKLNFSEVETATGVSWKLYNDGLNSKDYGFEEPQFAVVNELYDFEVDGDANIIGAGDDQIELTLTSTHKIDFGNMNIADSNVLKGFINWSGGNIDSISELVETNVGGKDKYRYEATLTLESPALADDEITFGMPSWASAYDNTMIDNVEVIDVED